jgi:hypothetical protein
MSFAKKETLLIDFVIPWVDGNDPEWIKLYNEHSSTKKIVASDDSGTFNSDTKRYQDIGLLRYWFRCIEKNASWVNKVFFITNGQKPDWLNLDCEKLVWVKHEDYIPKEYLPVFSSHPIELNLHRIKKLSGHFVYFNDDFFILNKIKKSHYFNNDFLPNDFAILNRVMPEPLGHIIINNLVEINSRFNKNEVIAKNKSKWFNPVYGKELLLTLFFNQYPRFSGFRTTHTAQPYLKSTFEEVWRSCEPVLCETSASKFRSITDVSQYLFRYWQLVTGKFHPVSLKGRKLFGSDMDIKKLARCFVDQRVKEICINDGETHEEVIELFKKYYPEKSGFEL